MRFLYHEPYTLEEVRKLLEERSTHTVLRVDDDKLNLAIVERASGELVGEAGLFLRSVANEVGEIGYTLHPDHQGKGYATEAAREVVRLGFQEVGLHRLFGSCEPRNEASARVL